MLVRRHFTTLIAHCKAELVDTWTSFIRNLWFFTKNSLQRACDTRFAKHFCSNHTKFPLEKSRYFLQWGLFPGPLSFQTLAIFTVDSLKRHSFFLKKGKIFFQPSSQKHLKCFYIKLPRKSIPWANTEDEKTCNLLSALNCRALKKKSGKFINQNWKNTWKDNLLIPDRENKNAVKKIYKHTDACVSLIRIRTECFFATSFYNQCIFPWIEWKTENIISSIINYIQRSLA